MAPPENRCEGQIDSHGEDNQAHQTRSRFLMVRRKCNKNGNFLPWSAQVKKPKEIGGGTITISSIETDVEAAVVASVVVHVFEAKRDPKNYIRNKRSKPPLECHNYLISRNRSDLPDSYDNKSIEKFALLCLKHYNNMVKNVEEKTEPMPEDQGMADAITLYRGAIRYDQKYKEGEVPPLKQAWGGKSRREGRNHSHREDDELLRMRNALGVQSESSREDENLLAMTGSGGRRGGRNQSHREDRDSDQSHKEDHNESLEKDEGQTRSRFAMVRRKFDKKGNNLLHWLAEVRKPKEIGGGLITINSIDTDVEAAVVASVVVHIFETKRDPKNYIKNRRSKPPLECHNSLISLNRSPHPDSYDNESIKKFAFSCLKDYKKLVKAVEEKTEPMPEDEAMAHAITLYRSAIRYDQKYKEGEVPPQKLNKRKRNSVESDHAGGDANPRPSVRRHSVGSPA